MNRKINNLEDLLQEKARLHAQIKIVQSELNASAQRTRREFKTLVDEKFSLSKQIGALFQGGAGEGVESTALRTVGRVIGGSNWWSGLLTTLLPMAVNFIRTRLENWKKKRAEAPPKKPKTASKSRKLFKRKTKTPDTDAEQP